METEKTPKLFSYLYKFLLCRQLFSSIFKKHLHACSKVQKMHFLNRSFVSKKKNGHFKMSKKKNLKNKKNLLSILCNKNDIKYTRSVDVSKNIISMLENELVDTYGISEYKIMEIEDDFTEFTDSVIFNDGKVNFINNLLSIA